MTDGFKNDSLEYFVQQSNTDIPVFSVAPVRLNFSGNPAVLVTDWKIFIEQHKNDTIHLFGYGLNKETLALFHPIPIVFHNGQPMPAITHIYWKQTLQPGEPLILQGHYENNTSRVVKIMLQAFGTSKDSVFVHAFTGSDFSLQTIPLHTGQAVFSLIATAGQDTLEKNPVPVAVQPVLPLQLLIISSSPEFENTFLKNYLARQGYQVSVITTISSNKASRQFLNMPRQQANKLTIPYLAAFDVLMADEAALQQLSAAELFSIRSVVREKGTGLLIQMGAQKNPGAFYTSFFPVRTLQQNKQAFLLLHEPTDSNRYKIRIADPESIVYTPGTQVILQDNQSGIFASAVVYGSGKIIGTTLQNTYSIALSGDKTSYQQLWWLLLNKAAKKFYPDESWQVYPFISFVNTPVQMQAEESAAAVPRAILHTTSIYLKQDDWLPFQWRGWYWPFEGGWQPLPQVHLQTGSWYVYMTDDWQRLTAYNHLSATKKYAALHPVSIVRATGSSNGLFNWPLLMVVIFLSSVAFLWLEQKMA